MATSTALTIAGSDSGGGAGIQADLKTFSALGVYGMSVITALTAQNTQTVSMIESVSQEMIAAQIAAIFSDIPPKAIKTGMLNDAQTIRTVATALKQHNMPPLVIDPVMVAKSGDKLLRDKAVAALRDEFIPLATIITPNIPEAEVLLGRSIDSSNDDALLTAAEDLLTLGCQSVLIKGGHAEGNDSRDLFYTKEALHWLTAPRHPTQNTHGTGCTLSAAIAAGLAKGQTLLEAVNGGKRYITEAIAKADSLNIGRGHGPVHHFYHWW